MQCAPSDIDVETVAHRVCGHSDWRQGSHYCQNYSELPLRAEDKICSRDYCAWWRETSNNATRRRTEGTATTVERTIPQWVRGVTEGKAAERETQSLYVTL